MIKIRISADNEGDLRRAIRTAENAFDVHQIKRTRAKGSPFIKAYLDAYFIDELPIVGVKDALRSTLEA